MLDDEMLAQLRSERDAAREEIAYLKEQLRSLAAYHAHLLEQERHRMLDELAKIASQMSTLREELHRRTFPGVPGVGSARVALTAVSSDGDGTGTDGDGTGTDGDGTGAPPSDGDEGATR
jgi:hypothetical protein